MKIKGNLLTEEEFWKSSKAGDWFFTDDTIWIRYGKNGEYSIHVVGATIAGEGSWNWNGSKESPTLSPSILTRKHTGTLFHGYMRDGELEYLPDSTIFPDIGGNE